MTRPWPRRRSPRQRAATLGLATLILATLGTLVNVVPHQAPAAALPDGSTPQVYVAGTAGASLLPMTSDTLGEATAAFPTASNGQYRLVSAVADTSDGAETVGVGVAQSTPSVFVMNPAAGATVGTVGFPAGDNLVGVAADPLDPGEVFVADGDTLFSVDTHALSEQQIYTLPPSDDGSFASLAVAPDGTKAYLGGALSNTGTPVNTVFVVTLPPLHPPSGWTATMTDWEAPAGDARFDGEVSDLTITPNGQQLFAVNNSSVPSSTTPPPPRAPPPGRRPPPRPAARRRRGKPPHRRPGTRPRRRSGHSPPLFAGCAGSRPRPRK
jgi:hypothetical protein